MIPNAGPKRSGTPGRCFWDATPARLSETIARARITCSPPPARHVSRPRLAFTTFKNAPASFVFRRAARKRWVKSRPH